MPETLMDTRSKKVSVVTRSVEWKVFTLKNSLSPSVEKRFKIMIAKQTVRSVSRNVPALTLTLFQLGLVRWHRVERCDLKILSVEEAISRKHVCLFQIFSRSAHTLITIT